MYDKNNLLVVFTIILVAADVLGVDLEGILFQSAMSPMGPPLAPPPSAHSTKQRLVFTSEKNDQEVCTLCLYYLFVCLFVSFYL